MGIFSESVLEEIKALQQIVGRPILDEQTLNQKSEEVPSSDPTMIITTGVPNQTMSNSDFDEDLSMQIIHADRNQHLDEFIKVL